MARLALLDGLGVGLAGAAERATKLAEQVIEVAGARPTATIWGSSVRTSALEATFINGIAAHVLDLDDTNDSMRGHPTAPLVPALLAVAEERGLAGSKVVDSFIVGAEVECMLGKVMNLEHFERGWHTTSTLGTIGVAAAVGYLLDLEEDQMCSALALACSLSSGLVRNFGAMSKSMHVGHAARSGVLAAMLAENGFTGNPEVLEAEDGFIEIFSGRPGNALEDVLPAFGEPWDIVDPGLKFKMYPTCSLTHSPIDATLELVYKHDIRPEHVEKITCYANYRIPMILTFPRPVDGLQAKFSLPYALAVAVCDRKAFIDEFSDERVVQDDVQALLRKVEFHIHEKLQTRESLANDFSQVIISLDDGRKVECTVTAARGTPANPVGRRALESKFRDCAERVLSPQRAEDALQAMRNMEELNDLTPLLKAIAG